MSLLDLITGGADEQAQQDLQNTLNEINGIQTPTAGQLDLGPLAQYTNQGNLNPALANAAQAGPSAFNNENISQVPISDMQQALTQEAQIANAQGMTPQEQASIAQAEQSVNENTAGQRGAIAQSFAGMGVPQSLISAALQNGTAGQQSQQAYQDALQAQGQAAGQGITALGNEGALASNLYGQEAGQANTVASAQNALNQFNAANTQQTNLSNQAAQQAANTYNTQNAQNLANENVSGANQALYQNEVQAPQEAASLALGKGQEQAGIGEAQAGQQMQEGQQAAGLAGGLLGAGATVGGDYALGSAIATGKAEGGEIPPKPVAPGIPFVRGGKVPGMAVAPGNSPRNDTVPARLSPGEFVVNRTDMTNPKVRAFLAANTHTPNPPSPHPSDISAMLRALGELRRGPDAQ